MKYEGEYLNGKKNGNGKEYNYDGRLMFEGEYLNGRKWNGKGYNDNGQIEYELINGCGKVKEIEYYHHTFVFEGEYLNGVKWNGKLM